MELLPSSMVRNVLFVVVEKLLGLATTTNRKKRQVCLIATTSSQKNSFVVGVDLFVSFAFIIHLIFR